MWKRRGLSYGQRAVIVTVRAEEESVADEELQRLFTALQAAETEWREHRLSGYYGEELGVISRTLGHANITTTANIYAHLTPAMLKRTATRMDGILTHRKRASGP
jgi:integrase